MVGMVFPVISSTILAVPNFPGTQLPTAFDHAGNPSRSYTGAPVPNWYRDYLGADSQLQFDLPKLKNLQTAGRLPSLRGSCLRRWTLWRLRRNSLARAEAPG